ncbi:hypothetical protein D3C78_832720 [compost metagenome]
MQRFKALDQIRIHIQDRADRADNHIEKALIHHDIADFHISEMSQIRGKEQTSNLEQLKNNPA